MKLVKFMQHVNGSTERCYDNPKLRDVSDKSHAYNMFIYREEYYTSSI
jgi:hypothetical protein